MSIAEQRVSGRRPLEPVRPVSVLDGPGPDGALESVTLPGEPAALAGDDPLAALLADPAVSEVMVNGPRRVFVRRGGRTEPIDARFVDDLHLRRVIDGLLARVGRHVDEANPVIDVRLPDGTRLHAVVPPIAMDGAMLTIRKKSAECYGVDDLIATGTVRRAIAYFLAACVRGRLDVLVSGGPGVGKTTTLNVLAQFLPTDERIITIEEVAELRLSQQHVLRLESRPAAVAGPAEVTVRDLVRVAHRMRPDRIVVGELRDGAALELLQAMSTGHDGTLTTINADSPREALNRLETMALLAGPRFPAGAIREELAAAVDLIVHQSRLRDGTRRITQVTEVVGMAAGNQVRLQDLFVFDYGAGEDEHGRLRGGLVYTGLRPHFLARLSAAGIAVPYGLFGFPVGTS
jgi:pilus assembly protein CpaF